MHTRAERRATSVSEQPDEAVRVLGIDLRSGPRYPTGLAVMGLDLRLRLLRTARTDEDIESAVERWQPTLVAIDAPLGLPEGRCCADPACECARFGILRDVDRACIAAGYRPFPTLLPSMVGLTLRGIALLAWLQGRGTMAVEVYPGMAQDVLGIPRKRADLAGLERGLRRARVRGLPRSRHVSHDELDAATCALVGVMHLRGATESMGPGVPVPLVFPRRAVPPRRVESAEMPESTPRPLTLTRA